MTGRPDYDAGDLVVCVMAKYRKHWLGRVFLVKRVFPPGAHGGVNWRDWGVGLLDADSPPSSPGWNAEAFRRIDPKPPEFWTGTVDADAGERVPA